MDNNVYTYEQIPTHTHTHTHTYIQGAYYKFRDFFFVSAFKIVVGFGLK